MKKSMPAYEVIVNGKRVGLYKTLFDAETRARSMKRYDKRSKVKIKRTTILQLHRNPCKRKALSINPKTVKKYKRFHGRKPDGITKVNVPDLKQLVFLGKTTSITYISDKKPFNKPTHYKHKFSGNVNMFTDKTGKALLILGTQFRVTDWLRG